jgi:hypothetical protein
MRATTAVSLDTGESGTSVEIEKAFASAADGDGAAS